jgi:hypothetical protein
MQGDDIALAPSPPPPSSPLDISHLKDGQQRLPKTVEIIPVRFRLSLKTELSSEQLHTQQGKNQDEQKEQQQQTNNRPDGIEKGCH